MNDSAWSEMVANLAVDAIIQAKLMHPEHFVRATEIVAEEILVRLSMGDRPIDGSPDPIKSNG